MFLCGLIYKVHSNSGHFNSISVQNSLTIRQTGADHLVWGWVVLRADPFILAAAQALDRPGFQHFVCP